MKSLRNNVKTHWTIAFCMVIMLLFSLGSMIYAASPVDPSPQEIWVTERDASRAIDLNGEVLILNLESNPSTGYGWQVRGLNERILRQVDTTEWQPDVPGNLGGSGTQVLRFAAIGKGRATLNLVYARPWETAAASAKTFSVDVHVVEPSKNVSYQESVAEEAPAAMDDEASLLALPEAYNWCDLDGCTPVRDQGNCGSCWAFGTVGPLESAILIQDGVSMDLSE